MGVMPPVDLVRCPAFVPTAGTKPSLAVVHAEPCTFVHPFDAEWDNAVQPDESMIKTYHAEHPVKSAHVSVRQRMIDEIFGSDDEDEADAASGRVRHLPNWKDLDRRTVSANLEALNSALAGIEMPTLEVQMDNPNPDAGPSVSWSATGGYTYPLDMQYSRPFPNKQTFAQSWTEIEKNAKKQWDEAHGLAQTRVAGVIGGRVISRPVINTSAPAGASAAPPQVQTPKSPFDKRKFDEANIKAESYGLGIVPSAKRPRREGSPELGPSFGEQLHQWRVVLQPMLRPEYRKVAGQSKMKEISNIVGHLEEIKDQIPRDLLGKIVERGGTKIGMVIGNLARVEDMPYESIFHVRERIKNLADYWSSKFPGG